MITQLLVGSLIASLTVAVSAAFLVIATRVMARLDPWLSTPPPTVKISVALAGAMLWLLAALTASVWIWAIAFMILDLFETLEPALYFAIVTFTTLGFGDIILPVGWRLLSGICAANGLLLFGLGAAFLVDVFGRLHRARAAEEQRD